jgi:hypothetical protein
MENSELNERLRELIRSLEQGGFKLTIVGKILLGNDGPHRLKKFLDMNVDLGIKPLSKIGMVMQSTPYIVFLEDGDPLIDQLKNKNSNFLSELQKNIGVYIEEGRHTFITNATPAKQRKKTEIDKILEEILEIDEDEDLNIKLKNTEFDDDLNIE